MGTNVAVILYIIAIMLSLFLSIYTIVSPIASCTLKSSNGMPLQVFSVVISL